MFINLNRKDYIVMTELYCTACDKELRGGLVWLKQLPVSKRWIEVDPLTTVDPEPYGYNCADKLLHPPKGMADLVAELEALNERAREIATPWRNAKDNEPSICY